MRAPPRDDDTYGVKSALFGLVLLLGAFASMSAIALERWPGPGGAVSPVSFEASAEWLQPSEARPFGQPSVTKRQPTAESATLNEAAVAGAATGPAPVLAVPPVDVAPVGVLPSAVAIEAPPPRYTAFEAELFERMNGARVDSGAPTLARNTDLDGVALARARDLVELGYFDHYAPDGTSAFTELASRGLAYYVAGENLARNNYPPAQTVQTAFDALMASPGHRANILEPRFGAVGVATVREGDVWLFVTVFTNPR
jgi:uncharacterized protein YkwD